LHRNRLIYFVTLCLLCFVANPSTQAQDEMGEDSPLLAMLALTPDSAQIDAFIDYTDFRAMEQARPGSMQPQSWDDLQRVRDDGDPAARMWLAASQGIQGQSNLLMSLFVEDWEPTVGFGFFDIDRVLSYGQPPAVGTVFAGDFDPQNIEDALTTLGYTSEALDNSVLMCVTIATDCEEGYDVNIEQRNTSNPFGGDLGRRFPVIVNDETIHSASSASVLSEQQRTIQGEETTLAQNPSYRMAANALTDEGPLIQALFVAPSLLGSPSDEVEQPETESLPAYRLLLMADSATETEQVVQIVLIYNNEDSAQAAAEALPTRLENYRSVMTDDLFISALEATGEVSYAASVYANEDDDRFAAVLTLRTPLAENNLDDASVQSSSLLYARFYEALIFRDLGWLSPDSSPE